MGVYAASAPEADLVPESQPLVTLKKAPKAFRPPEHPDSDTAADGSVE